MVLVSLLKFFKVFDAFEEASVPPSAGEAGCPSASESLLRRLLQEDFSGSESLGTEGRGG